jgi:hypothetical protein
MKKLIFNYCCWCAVRFNPFFSLDLSVHAYYSWCMLASLLLRLGCHSQFGRPVRRPLFFVSSICSSGCGPVALAGSRLPNLSHVCLSVLPWKKLWLATAHVSFVPCAWSIHLEPIHLRLLGSASQSSFFLPLSCHPRLCFSRRRISFAGLLAPCHL